MNRPEQRDPRSGYVALGCILCAVLVIGMVWLGHVAGWQQ